jgi:hypothetical protein
MSINCNFIVVSSRFTYRCYKFKGIQKIIITQLYFITKKRTKTYKFEMNSSYIICIF